MRHSLAVWVGGNRHSATGVSFISSPRHPGFTDRVLDAQPGWQPPADLLHFLESGSPPVYAGFGSVSQEHPERRARLILRALELTGQRGVLSTGWGGLTRLSAPPNVFFVDNVPHAWLFPRMAAVVHHGGAGTTGAGLRAGVPGIITPGG